MCVSVCRRDRVFVTERESRIGMMKFISLAAQSSLKKNIREKLFSFHKVLLIPGKILKTLISNILIKSNNCYHYIRFFFHMST